MAANYYKLKGKVWGEKKDKQNTHSYTRVMAVWLMEIKKKKKNLQNNLQTQLVCI